MHICSYYHVELKQRQVSAQHRLLSIAVISWSLLQNQLPCMENRVDGDRAVSLSPPSLQHWEANPHGNSPSHNVCRSRAPRFTLESYSVQLSKTLSKLKALRVFTGQRGWLEAEGSRERLTSDNLVHMVSCQPSSGGDSGRNTQSAPQAKALTRARYLHGDNKDRIRLLLGTQSSAMALGRRNAEPAWELLAPREPPPTACALGRRALQGAVGGSFPPELCLHIRTRSVSP